MLPQARVSITGTVSNSTRPTGSVGDDPQQLALLDEPAHDSEPAPLEWRVRVSKRARNLKIQVYPHGGVEIVAPRRTRARDIESFVTEHGDWIRKTRAEFLRNRGDEQLLPETINLRAIGQQLNVDYLPGKQLQVREREGCLRIRAPLHEPATVWPALQLWLRKRARPHLTGQLEELSAITGLQHRRMQVRLQSSCWGSCSANGTLSLNAALMLRPAEELRYVLVHELCHLRHMNHSRRYWALVERFVPHYRELEQTLNKAWETTPFWLSKQ